jgi:hypothetical protein
MVGKGWGQRAWWVERVGSKGMIRGDGVSSGEVKGSREGGFKGHGGERGWGQRTWWVERVGSKGMVSREGEHAELSRSNL